MKNKDKYDLRSVNFEIQKSPLGKYEVVFKSNGKEICRKEYDVAYHLTHKGNIYIDFTLFLFNWLESESENAN